MQHTKIEKIYHCPAQDENQHIIGGNTISLSVDYVDTPENAGKATNIEAALSDCLETVKETLNSDSGVEIRTVQEQKR